MKGVVGTAVFLTLFIPLSMAAGSLAPDRFDPRRLEYVVFGLGVLCLVFAHATVAFLSPRGQRRPHLISGAGNITIVCAYAFALAALEAAIMALGWRDRPFSAGPMMWFFLGLLYCYAWPLVRYGRE